MSSQPRLSSWITCPKPNSLAALRLFCLPYAGGGASLFREWPRSLPRAIEVCLVQLPGRENRLTERPFDQIEPLVQTLAEEILPFLDKPFAFFGHSMGALISFELVRYLREKSRLSPIHFFASGHRAPQLPDPHPPIYALPLPDFLKELRTLNGTPDEVLQHEELMHLVLPMLQADFALAETYTYVPGEPLTCPLSAFGGLLDKDVSQDEVAAWQQQTSSTFILRLFPGNHFFVKSDRTLLLQTIVSELATYLR